ncbi:MAG TPA: HD domain-containing phosphohydrolase [Syntrophorhabdaceae bacterium]|jgi:PAS domain S-box-containing protein/putative nucleotidyltransferase with HDIG domain
MTKEQLMKELTEARNIAARAQESERRLKRAADGLKKSEARYREMVELANSIILRLDPDGNILLLNQFGLKLFGYTQEELIGRNLIGTLVPLIESSGRQTVHLVESISKNPDMYMEHENENICKNGKRVWVLWTNKAIYDLSGRITEIICIGNDITGRKEAEQALVEARGELETKVRERTGELEKAYEELKYEVVERKIGEEELRESARKYRTIVEEAVEGIFQINGDGVCIMANAALAHMLGYNSPGEFISTEMNGEGKLFVDPRDYRELRRRLKKDGYVKGFETQYRKRDGKAIWVSMNVRAVYDERGSFVWHEGTVEDVSARKKADEQLKESYVRLQRVMEGTIKALSMAIEIRDPYTAGHQIRVTRLAEAIALDMKLTEDHIKAIRIAGLVHDIGKITVPAEILARPGRISVHEYAVLRDHSEAGYEILKDIEFDYPIAEIVLQHHERLDGSGYPHGLRGKKINLEARIISVADVVESMASHRPYRPSLGIEKALDEIKENRGTLYDRHAVDACLRQFAGKKFTFGP